MRSTAAAALAGIIGIGIGAAGWAALGPAKTVHDDKPVAAASSPATARPAAAGVTHYDSGQAIATKLKAAGFVVGKLRPNTDNLLTQQGATVYDLTISPQAGVPAGDDSGINLFPKPADLTAWTETSKGFGGVAVVGDTWAVSLPSGDGVKVQSISMAPRIAKALGGTVAE